MYGIWDYSNKRFVFGVREPTKREAIASLRARAPGLWESWRRYGRYEAKEIPEGWKNKKNWLTKIYGRSKDADN